MDKLLAMALFVLMVACASPAKAQGKSAGLPCNNPTGAIQFGIGSDAMDDLLACTGGIWRSMIFGKDNTFPKNHPQQTVTLGGYYCTSYTDASGNPYLSMPGADLYVLVASTHVLIGTNGGTQEICLADPSGISLNAGLQAAFVPWD